MSVFTPVGDVFGLNGDQGDYYKGGKLNTRGADSLASLLQAARSGQVNTAGQSLLNGGNLADAVRDLNSDETSGLAINPIYGQKVAEQQTMDNPLLSGLLGKGGSRDQALEEETRLRDQGFKLKPEDVEAYGQASGNIARMFGKQEQSLSHALANRGLAAGGSNNGTAQFTGLMGNKNEQLAQLQMGIANARMQNTQQRLAQTRQYLTQMGSLGEQGVNDAFNRNMAGYNAKTNTANSLAAADRGDFAAQQSVDQASKESELANKKKNLGDAWAAGTYSGLQSGTQSATQFWTGFAGGGMGMAGGGGGGGMPGGGGGGGGVGGYAPTNTGSVNSGGNGGFSVGRNIKGFYGS